MIAAIAAILVFQWRLRTADRQKDETLARQAERVAQLESENERLSNLVAQASDAASANPDPSPELLRLRSEVGALRQQINELGGLRKENVRLSQVAAVAQTNQIPVEDQLVLRQTHTVDAITTLLSAIKTYATNHNGQYPASFDQLVDSGDLKSTNFAGNLGLGDFEFSPNAGLDPQGNQAILKLRVPIPNNPGGGGITVVGRITPTGITQTSSWNVSP